MNSEPAFKKARRSRRLSGARRDQEEDEAADVLVALSSPKRTGSAQRSCNQGSEDFLDAFIESRQEIIQSTAPSSRAYSTNRVTEPPLCPTVLSEIPGISDAGRLSCTAMWQLRLSTLPRDFFVSREAKLLVNSTNNASNTPLKYNALFMDDKVLCDLIEYYKNQVEPHVCRSQCIASYTHFKVALGQLARYAAAVGRFDPNLYCASGGLFKLSVDEKLLRAFVVGMQTRCAASTVASKAANLLKWVKFSVLHYCKIGDDQHRALCETSASYIRSVASAEKRESRRQTRVDRNPLARLQNALVILPEDFEKAQQRAEDRLRGLLRTVNRDITGKGATDISEKQQIVYDLFCTKGSALMRKWCLNFLCLIVMHAGGQRAQVFSELELEAFGVTGDGLLVQGLEAVEKAAENSGYYYLQVAFEKRSRMSRMPFIRLPFSTLDLYLTHRNLVLPCLLRKSDKQADPSSVSYLILNSENGNTLTAKQVSFSVKSFFKDMNLELGSVTPLVIRRSYASLMYHRFMQGEIFKGKSRSEFLDYLAERMNTSLDQLEHTYCTDESVEQIIARIFSSE